MRSGAVQVLGPNVRVWPPLQDETISLISFQKALRARRKVLDEVQREAAAAARAAAAEAAAEAAAAEAAAAAAAAPPVETSSGGYQAGDTDAPDHAAEQPATTFPPAPTGPPPPQPTAPAAPATVPAGAPPPPQPLSAAAKAEQRRERKRARKAAARAQLEASREAKVQRKGDLERRQSAAAIKVEELKTRLDGVEQEKHRLVGQLRQVLQAEGLQRRPSVVTLGGGVGPDMVSPSAFSPVPPHLQLQMQQHQQLLMMQQGQMGAMPVRSTSMGSALPGLYSPPPGPGGLPPGTAAGGAGAHPDEAQNAPGQLGLPLPYGVVPYGTPLGAAQPSPHAFAGIDTHLGGAAARVFGGSSGAAVTTGPGAVSVPPAAAAAVGAAGGRFMRAAHEDEDEGEIREDGEYGGGGAAAAAGHSGPGVVGPSGGLAGLPAGPGPGPGPGPASVVSPTAGAPHGGLGVGPGPGSSAGHGLPGPGVPLGIPGHTAAGPSPSPYGDPSRRGGAAGAGGFADVRPALMPQAQTPLGVGPPGAGAQMPGRGGPAGKGMGGWQGPGAGGGGPFGGHGGPHSHHGGGPPLGRGSGGGFGRISGGGWREDDMMGEGMSYGGYGRGRGMGGFPLQGPPRRNW